MHCSANSVGKSASSENVQQLLVSAAAGGVLAGNGQPSHPQNPSHMHGKSVWLPHGYFDSDGVYALGLPRFGNLCDIPRKHCGFRCRTTLRMKQT